MCSAEHSTPLLLISPMCFYVFAHLSISPHAGEMPAHRLFCGQLGGTTPLLDAIFCPRVHHSFSDGLLLGGAGSVHQPGSHIPRWLGRPCPPSLDLFCSCKLFFFLKIKIEITVISTVVHGASPTRESPQKLMPQLLCCFFSCCQKLLHARSTLFLSK